MPKRVAIELPADPSATYEPPLSVGLDDINELITSAKEQARALLQEDASDEDVATANRYIAAAKALNDRKGQIVAEIEERNRQRQEALDALDADDNTDTGDADDGTSDDDDDEGGTPPVVQTGDVSDPAATGAEPALVAAGGDGHGRTVIRPAGQPAGTPTGRRSAVAAAAGVGPGPQLPIDIQRDRGAPATITAAAGVRGMTAGQEIEWDGLGVAAENRFNALPKPRPGSRPGGGETKLPIASVNIATHDEALVASGKGDTEFVDAERQMEWAVSNARLEKETGLTARQARESGQTLLAAGGWCAPSETLYDLLDITTDDGLLDVPGITVTRGGVRYALGPDFTAVYVTGNANFSRTEAQAIAGTPTKPMVNIPCPTFTDNRMVVDGLYLTGDILTAKGYPEAYADYTRKALKAFAHFVNAASITDQVNLSTVVDLSTSTGTAPLTNRSQSAVVETLGAIELQVMDMRYKNRLSQDQAVELVAPFWLQGNLRSDLAKRQGTDYFDVSVAQIEEWFRVRGASIQWVYDWQDAFTGVAAGFGAATAIAGWPLTANILMYPQGTFVRALDPVIELNAVYDSTLLQTNQFVALFMEQGRLTLKRHWDARNVKVAVAPFGATVAGIAINGTAGAPQLGGSVL